MSDKLDCNFCNKTFSVSWYVSAGLAAVFVAIALLNKAGTNHAFDERIFAMLVDYKSGPLGADWIVELARDVTAMGSITVLVIICLVAAGYFLMVKNQFAALYIGMVLGGALIGSTLLKALFERARPGEDLRLTQVFTSSFPSAHALHSAAVFIGLGLLFAGLNSEINLRRYFMTMAFGLALLIGCSRIFLGVHWPTDILAGWFAGACWATLCTRFSVILGKPTLR